MASESTSTKGKPKIDDRFGTTKMHHGMTSVSVASIAYAATQVLLECIYIYLFSADFHSIYFRQNLQ